MHDWSYENVKKKITDAGFSFPFIVKPDVGMKGILFRKIDNDDQLVKYHEKIPVEYIVQELIELPVEVSVFYYRFPWEKKGVVTGFIDKELLHDVNSAGIRIWWQLVIHLLFPLPFKTAESNGGIRSTEIPKRPAA